jgi:multiple sugar transport system ATP-binding protein
MARLVLERLDCWYGRTHAVDHIDLTVEDGELCVLLGPSGSGKTTTLRMIAGLVRPTGGEIYLDGRRITHLYPGQRGIGMVFQSYALYPHMTVREQLLFPLQAMRMGPAERQQRVQAVADLLHIGDLLDRYPSQLSAGQRQRVALGRALVRHPALLLLDEPLSNVDAMLREEVRASLRRLQQELRITTVYVTHDQVEAQALADKIVVMHQGRIQQVGSPQELYRRPANVFVAGFLGMPPMNFIEVEAISEGGTLVLRNRWLILPMPPEWRKDLPRALILGVRPEHLRVHPPREGDPMAAEVIVIEPHGHEMILHVRVHDHLLRCRADPRQLGFRPQPGDRVSISFNLQHIHLFDRTTEQRIA